MAIGLVDHTRRNPWRCHVGRYDMVAAMSVRDKIADKLRDADDEYVNTGECPSASVLADAIIDMIKSNLPLLEWYDTENYGSVNEFYYVSRSTVGCQWNLKLVGIFIQSFNTIEESKAAAQAHHVERLMKGLGL